MLEVCEFTSDRKRMSVVAKDLQTNTIKVFTKGADSVIENLLESTFDFTLHRVLEFVEEYAEKGLRTLLLA